MARPLFRSRLRQITWISAAVDGRVRTTNQSLTAFVGEESAFIDDILSGQTDPPLYFERMKRQNRDGVPPLELTAPPVLTVDECTGVDLDDVVVIDTRPWELFRQSHLRNAHWSAPFGSPPVGSYIKPEQAVASLVEPDEAEHYLRLMLRIGLDRIVGMITPQIFKEASRECDTSSANEINAVEFQREIEAGSTRVLDVRSTDEFERGRVSAAAMSPTRDWPTSSTSCHRSVTSRFSSIARAACDLPWHCRTSSDWATTRSISLVVMPPGQGSPTIRRPEKWFRL